MTDSLQPRREVVATSLLLLDDFANSIQPHERIRSTIGTQTEFMSQSLAELEDECDTLRKEKYELCKVVQDFQISIDSFKSDNVKLKFYTGLDSFEALESVFNLIAPFVENHHRSALSMFNQFLMVLMKLRLNLTDQDLGYRFGVSQSTVSKNWKKWVNIMYRRLMPLVMWPEREQLYKTMPLTFKNPLNVCVL